MKLTKRLSCLLLALVMAASFWSCASSGDSGDTTEPGDTTQPDTTTVPDDTTAPDVTVDFQEVTDPTVNFGPDPIETKPGEVTGEDAETVQLRLREVGSNWKNAFDQEKGCFAVAASAQELDDLIGSKLPSQELDLSAYDDAFFAENRLVLIPRSSNSGSVRYQAKVNPDGDMLHIDLDAQMPEMGTADMAEWLVLVVLPNAEYDAMTITVPVPAGNSGTGTVTK